MLLDTAQHMIQVFGSEMTDDIELLYPAASTGANSRTRISIEDESYAGFITPHELGHSLHEQIFNQDYLVGDYSLSGPSHSIYSVEYESVATSEGFADFVAAASWWYETNASSVPLLYGLNFESATPVFTTSCFDNTGVEGMVARGFWDLIDANDEVAVQPAIFDDQYHGVTASYVAAGWELFPNGQANHENDESDVDGVNLRDYYENNKLRFGADFWITLLSHNCLDGQGPN